MATNNTTTYEILATEFWAARLSNVVGWTGIAAATADSAGFPKTLMADGVHGGSNSTINLKQLNVVNPNGTAVVAKSTGGDGHGAEIVGAGTGNGINAAVTGGGSAIAALGGANGAGGIVSMCEAPGALALFLSSTGGGGPAASIVGSDQHAIYLSAAEGIRIEASTFGINIVPPGSGNFTPIKVARAGTGKDVHLAGDGAITGNLSGSVGSVIGNVGGNLLGTLSTAERNAIADALLGRSDGIETGITPRQALRAIAAVVAGVITTSQEAQEIFKALGATSLGTTRVTLTVDSEGNRSAVTLDL